MLTNGFNKILAQSSRVNDGESKSAEEGATLSLQERIGSGPGGLYRSFEVLLNKPKIILGNSFIRQHERKLEKLEGKSNTVDYLLPLVLVGNFTIS